MFGKIQTLEHLFQPGLSPAFPPTPPPPSASGIAFSLISPTPIPTPSRLWFRSSLGNRVLFSKLSEISPKQDTRDGLCLFFTEGWERSSFIAKYGALRAKYEGFLGCFTLCLSPQAPCSSQFISSFYPGEKTSLLLEIQRVLLQKGAVVRACCIPASSRAPREFRARWEPGVEGSGGCGWFRVESQHGRTGSHKCPQDADK